MSKELGLFVAMASSITGLFWAGPSHPESVIGLVISIVLTWGLWAWEATNREISASPGPGPGLITFTDEDGNVWKKVTFHG